jgi:biuret amidohydrolase
MHSSIIRASSKSRPLGRRQRRHEPVATSAASRPDEARGTPAISRGRRPESRQARVACFLLDAVDQLVFQLVCIDLGQPCAKSIPQSRKECGPPMRTTIAALPEPLAISIDRTAVLMIDMQRDFIEPGGFGASLGNDVALLRRAIGPCQALLAGARAAGMLVIHTREGHRADLSDAPPAKLERGEPRLRIGAAGPMGRILVRGEPGHALIPELQPLPGEPVIDKPGKGAFHATELGTILQYRGIETLVVCGVTTEVCVHSTVREANDRGYRCVVPGDCCASYFPEFHEVALRMIHAQGGIFGWVSDSARVLAALASRA